MKKIFLILSTLLMIPSISVACPDFNGTYLSLSSTDKIVINQKICESIELEWYEADGYRNQLKPGLVNGKCNDICSYAQPGCMPTSMKPDRCLPVCGFTSCRLFGFSSDQLVIQESGQGVIFPPEYPADLTQTINFNGDKNHLKVITSKRNQSSIIEEYQRIQ